MALGDDTISGLIQTALAAIITNTYNTIIAADDIAVPFVVHNETETPNYVKGGTIGYYSVACLVVICDSLPESAMSHLKSITTAIEGLTSSMSDDINVIGTTLESFYTEYSEEDNLWMVTGNYNIDYELI